MMKRYENKGITACVKCGSYQQSRKYDKGHTATTEGYASFAGWVHPHPARPDRLNFTCGSCGYEWTTLCMDAEKGTNEKS